MMRRFYNCQQQGNKFMDMIVRRTAANRGRGLTQKRYFSGGSGGSRPASTRVLSIVACTLVPLFYFVKRDMTQKDETNEISNKSAAVDQLLDELYNLDVQIQKVQEAISTISTSVFTEESEELQVDLQLHCENYVSVVEKIDVAMSRIAHLSDEEFSSQMSLALITKHEYGYQALRSCMLLNLNSKSYLRDKYIDGMRNLKTQESLDRIHFNAMIILNRMTCADSEYAKQIVKQKMIGPCFNTLLRSQSTTLKKLASDLLCNLANRESTHDALLEWVTTFKFMVETRHPQTMFTAAYMITKMFCNDNVRPLLSQTQFLPYTNLLDELFENSTGQTRMYASFGLLLSQGKVNQKKFLETKEQNNEYLHKLKQSAIIAGISLAWIALNYKVGRPVVHIRGAIVKSTLIASLFGISLIAREDVKDYFTKHAHGQFVNEKKLSSIPPITLSHAGVVALLQMLAISKAGALFIVLPYLLQAAYFELYPKHFSTSIYELYLEQYLRNITYFQYRLRSLLP